MNKRSRRWWVIVALSVVSLLIAAGCGPQAQPTAPPAVGEGETPAVEEPTEAEEPVEEAGEPIVIDMWHWAANKEPLYQVAIEEYKSIAPNVTIQTNVIPQDTWQQTLTSALIGGEAPALFHGQPKGPVLEQWNNGQIVDLTPYIDQEWRDALYPSTWDILTIEDKVMSMSFATNNVQMFYNKTRFEELGIETPIKTMAELQAATQQLRDAGYGGGLYWAQLLQLTPQFFIGYATQLYPDEFLAADIGDGAWDVPEFVDLMEQVNGFSDIWEPGVTSISLDEAVNAFATGEVSYYFIGNWAINSILANEPDFEVATQPIPALSDATDYMAMSSTAGTWMVSNQHPQEVQDAAIAFLRWFALNHQGLIVEGIGLCPAGPAGEAALENATDLAKQLCDDSDILISRDMFSRVVQEEMASAMQGMLAGDVTPEQVLEAAQEAKVSQ